MSGKVSDCIPNKIHNTSESHIHFTKGEYVSDDADAKGGLPESSHREPFSTIVCLPAMLLGSCPCF